MSVSYAAIALAKKIFGELDGLNVLILGAGEMAKLTARTCRRQGVKQLTIASRTLETAERLASRLNGRAVPWTSIGQALAAADIVVTATGAREPVLTRAGVEEAMRPRRSRPLFLIDIAVPRDVDPEAGQLDQVFLYNIDDLQTIVGENLARRTSEVDRAERDRPQEVDRFRTWMQSQEVVPTVVALRQRFEAIRQAELQRLEPRLASMPPEARARVDEITHLLVEKLLLTPTEQLKAAEDQAQAVAYSDALNSPVQPDGPEAESRRLMKPVRIGTRGSALALWQARTVAALLESRGRASEICVIKTDGDRLQDRAALGSGRQGAVRQGNRGRAARRRRRSGGPQRQGHVGRPAGRPRRLRGPATGGFARRAGAAAGAERPRSGAADRDRQRAPQRAAASAAPGCAIPSDSRECGYAAAETRCRRVRRPGARRRRVETAGPRTPHLGPRSRTTNASRPRARASSRSRPVSTTSSIAEVLRTINDVRSAACFEAERAVVAALGGGCQLPLGAVAVLTGDRLDMQALVASPDGSRQIRRRLDGDASRPAELGQRLAGGPGSRRGPSRS